MASKRSIPSTSSEGPVPKRRGGYNADWTRVFPWHEAVYGEDTSWKWLVFIVLFASGTTCSRRIKLERGQPSLVLNSGKTCYNDTKSQQCIKRLRVWRLLDWLLLKMED